MPRNILRGADNQTPEAQNGRPQGSDKSEKATSLTTLRCPQPHTILERCDQNSLNAKESEWIRRLESWHPRGLNYQDHDLGEQRSSTTPPHTAASPTTPPTMPTSQSSSIPSAAPPTTDPGLITGESDTPMGPAHAITLAPPLTLALALGFARNIFIRRLQ